VNDTFTPFLFCSPFLIECPTSALESYWQILLRTFRICYKPVAVLQVFGCNCSAVADTRSTGKVAHNAAEYGVQVNDH
jgi:hypothetical protein